MINDRSQGTTAKYLSYDGLVHYKFIKQFTDKRILKIALPHYIESRGYEMVPVFVRLSVLAYGPTAANSLLLFRCCGPAGREISIDCCSSGVWMRAVPFVNVRSYTQICLIILTTVFICVLQITRTYFEYTLFLVAYFIFCPLCTNVSTWRHKRKYITHRNATSAWPSHGQHPQFHKNGAQWTIISEICSRTDTHTHISDITITPLRHKDYQRVQHRGLSVGVTFFVLI